MLRPLCYALLLSSALSSCASSPSPRAADDAAPARAVPFDVEGQSGATLERLVGIAYIRPDRIDVAVTEAQLAPDTPSETVERVRAILVKGDPVTSWDIAVRSSSVSVVRVRALARTPGDTVRFELRGTGGEPLAERRLSFWLEAEVTIPGRGRVPATRPIQGALGNLAAR